MKQHPRGMAVIALLSGACGLAWEVLYNRVLGSIFGDSFQVNFAILFTFLTGIALGYLLAHRLKRWLFLVEAGIGLYGIGSMALILRTESFSSDHFLGLFPIFSGASLIWLLLYLAPPSILIGVSIPVLSRYMARSRADGAFDRTYFFYNLGAAATILMIEFALLQLLSISLTVYLVGGVNLAIAAALFAQRAIYRAETVHPLNLRLVGGRKLIAFLLFSMISAGYQLLLMKMNTFVFGPFRENFSLTVFMAIAYISLGTWIQSRWPTSFVNLLRRGLYGLGFVLATFGLSTYLYALVVSGLGESPLLIGLAKLAWIGLWALPLLVFGMGVPVLLRETAFTHVENASGLVLFYSAAGNALGTALLFFVLHPLLGYGALLLCLGIGLALALGLSGGLSPKTFLRSALLLLLGLLLWNEKVMYISHSEFSHPQRLVHQLAQTEKIEPFHAHNQTLAVIHRRDGRESLFINGYHSILLSNRFERLVGVIPALIDPEAKRGLVLGLGAGITAGAASRVTDDLTAVEINGAIVAHQDRFARINFGVHKNPEVKLVLDDGIRFLKHSSERYDWIINTVTSPLYFSSSKLYTVDFFQIVKRRLANNGIYYTWLDARCGSEGAFILVKSLSETFRHVGIIGLLKKYYLLYASDAPFPVQARLDPTRMAALSAVCELDFPPHAAVLSADLSGPATRDRLSGLPLNTIDRPVLEYKMARLANLDDYDAVFSDFEAWIEAITQVDVHPLTGRAPTPEQARERFLYHSLSLGYPAIARTMAERTGHADQDAHARRNRIAHIRADARLKGQLDLETYLENRARGDLSANRSLLEGQSFEGQVVFECDLALAEGQPERCLARVWPLLRLDFANPNLHALAGDCRLELGETIAGRAHLETALSLKPALHLYRARLLASYLRAADRNAQRLAIDHHLKALRKVSSDLDVIALTERLSAAATGSAPASVEVPKELLFYDGLRLFKER